MIPMIQEKCISPPSSAATCQAASACQLYTLPEVAQLPTRLWHFTLHFINMYVNTDQNHIRIITYHNM